MGGKIPDTAFETDRLALNRLQKEGIAVPDGILLEQRSPQVIQQIIFNKRYKIWYVKVLNYALNLNVYIYYLILFIVFHP